jgi:hypothetical protein
MLAVVWFLGTVPTAVAQGTLSFNGTFDAGAAGWIMSGGAVVVAAGEADDDPHGRMPDGPLVFLYQRMSSSAIGFRISFDFFAGSMSPAFPSPGGFPDTAFGTVYFAATAAGLRPELLESGASVGLFDFDAVNGLRGVLVGATVEDSPDRRGWRRFSSLVDSVAGQPHFAVTFQTLDGNGMPGDSAFLVDNLFVIEVPEPRPELLAVAGLALIGCSRVRAKWR